MNKNILTISFLLLVFQAISQVTFEKGYIITLKGDTIRGEIKRNPKKDVELYTKIMFKISENEKKTYNATKIKEYNIKEQLFIAKQIDNENVFVRRVAVGAINLYEYEYEDQGPSGDAAINTDYYVQKMGKEEWIKLKENKFRKQLAELMSDNKEIVAELEDKKIALDKILEIIEKYNSWYKENNPN